MRLWLVGLVVGLALAAAPGASGAYTVEPTLTRVAGVETRCYEPGAWELGNEYGGYWDGTVIALRANACRWIGRTLAGERPADWRRTIVALNWHLFAHEVAHSQGFDHGEKTVGADCRGWRIMRPLMRAAGIGRRYAYVLWVSSAHRASCPSSAP